MPVKRLAICPHRTTPAASRHDGLSVSAAAMSAMTSAKTLFGPADRGQHHDRYAQLLLAHHLKALKLPTFLREYDKLARQWSGPDGLDHIRFLLRLAELELIDRERRMVERRSKTAKFPAVKSLDSFDFAAIASLDKTLVLELARSEYVTRRGEHHRGRQQRHRQDHVCLELVSRPARRGCRSASTPPRLSSMSCWRLATRNDDSPSAAACWIQAPDHRRAWICALLPDRRRAVVRGVQPAISSEVQLSSPRTCRSTNEPCSVPSGSPVRCSIGSPITSISWK